MKDNFSPDARGHQGPLRFFRNAATDVVRALVVIAEQLETIGTELKRMNDDNEQWRDDYGLRRGMYG